MGLGFRMVDLTIYYSYYSEFLSNLTATRMLISTLFYSLVHSIYIELDLGVNKCALTAIIGSAP